MPRIGYLVIIKDLFVSWSLYNAADRHMKEEFIWWRPFFTNEKKLIQEFFPAQRQGARRKESGSRLVQQTLSLEHFVSSPPRSRFLGFIRASFRLILHL